MNESFSLNRIVASFVLDSFGSREKGNRTVRAISSVCNAPTIDRKGNSHQRVVGVFLHHRDAKVALEELRNAGLPMGWIALIARNGKRYNWMPDLTVCDRFDEDGFSEESWQFFHKYYKRGRYLVIIEGTDDAIRYAQAIMSRRRGRSEVWHLQANN
jgi:hypothetical protein